MFVFVLFCCVKCFLFITSKPIHYLDLPFNRRINMFKKCEKFFLYVVYEAPFYYKIPIL